MKPSQVASYLRRIASAIEKSRKPDRLLVARDLRKLIAGISLYDPNFKFQGKFTSYDGMNDPSGDAEWRTINDFNEVSDYLNAGENNAVIIEDEGLEYLAIWNGPGGFYYQGLPLQDPNDAEFELGGDGKTVEKALEKAYAAMSEL